jgi:hypothetical protein
MVKFSSDKKIAYVLDEFPHQVEIQIVDFNWAGGVEEACYPHYQNMWLQWQHQKNPPHFFHKLTYF